MNEIKLNTKTSFLEIMGVNPINRVLDFLIENDRESWTMAEISRNAGVGYSTLKVILPKMEKNKLIVVVKKVGKLKLYTINKDSEITKKIYSLYKAINLEKFKSE
jgi:predicted transcriptional regulator